MEDITIVYHVLRKRVLLINQIIKMIKQESTFLWKIKEVIMHCYECPYTSKVQRKYGVTTHCNLEPTNMDVTFHIMKKDNNKLCPFVCKGTRFPGVDYSKYIDDKIALWIKEK